MTNNSNFKIKQKALKNTTNNNKKITKAINKHNLIMFHFYVLRNVALIVDS